MWNQGFYIHLPEKLSAGQHELKVRVEKDHAAAGIWKEVALMNLAQELSPYTRYVAKRYKETDTSFVPQRRNKDYRQNFFDRIDTLLNATPFSAPEQIKSGSILKNAASMPSSHKTFEIIEDDTAVSGKCARQMANKRWTLGQAMTWRMGEILEKTPEKSFKLRVRIKVNKKANKGEAFRLGFYYQNQNWSGGTCAPEIAVNAADVRDGEWFWFEYPHLLKYKKYDRYQLVAVFAANNPENIESVCVDQYEIYPAD